ncbi:hypothetical protein CJF42_04975 [Pseudoalteromonas sp. NBT06-2]|uniref:tRNA (adenine(22)-N(1))-methyltransferase n=1 Tax=Pseudoalteromonas sp. NBT06-2 TaxID=2025950 RepID=UPI000BA71B8C|nr:tRNA (adenine(22)-N(1))-methyltransferase TrmK [Pseudoalteromonas sp. NBT06-2]PAJ75492.1 hypothetical protein CJF42_04975 [Pseudoalteromonas sp. NBT06-2]
MKISKRLERINNMIINKYDHIWDCCCDHGQLGIKLLTKKIASKIHFVDIVSPLMTELETKLQRYFSVNPTCKNWQVYCLDVAQLPLESTCKKSKQLVIIAGVGGDLLIELVNGIIKSNPEHNLEFLLCPVHHHYKVRKSLKALELGLIDEQIIRENNRFYEILHVSKTAIKAINPVGSIMWNFTKKDHKDYLLKTINHYQRMAQKTDQETLNILAQYQSLIDNDSPLYKSSSPVMGI